MEMENEALRQRRQLIKQGTKREDIRITKDFEVHVMGQLFAGKGMGAQQE